MCTLLIRAFIYTGGTATLRETGDSGRWEIYPKSPFPSGRWEILTLCPPCLYLFVVVKSDRVLYGTKYDINHVGGVEWYHLAFLVLFGFCASFLSLTHSKFMLFSSMIMLILFTSISRIVGSVRLCDIVSHAS